MIVKITRYSQDENQTLGSCVVLNDKNEPVFSSISLERGWRGNERNISCVPIGVYELVLEYSPRFKKYLWELKGVDGRSECKFHASNFWKQLNGCIALGNQPTDINNDGYLDVLNSGNTMKLFHKAFKKETKALLIITGKENIF